jgi:hypothetical protein
MKYIKLIFLVIFLLTGIAYADENIFKSITVGFEVTKPKGWSFVTAQENLDNLKRTKLSDDEFHQLMLKYATAPLVAMMKYPEPYDDLNPSLKVNIKPFGQLKGRDGKEVISLILPQFQKMFKDFQLVQAPIDVKVAGLKAAYVRINYSLQIPDGRTFPTTSELWIVPRGDYFFMIGAGTRQDEKTGSRKEIEQIMKSIKIEN